MSQATVDEILDIIDALPESQRDLLEQKLAARWEAEWRKAAEEARRQAQLRGIDQAAIDDRVNSIRYDR
jgi:hypothetical protein